MKTLQKALYRAGDFLVLKQDQKQLCQVTQNQPEHTAFVRIHRSGQAADELIREDDLIPIGLREVQA